MAVTPAQLLADGLSAELTRAFIAQFPQASPAQSAFLKDAGATAIQHMTQTSASYHGAEHVIMVTLAGQDILRGKAYEGDLNATDWIHAITAMLFHDVGFSRTACKDDRENDLVADATGGRFRPEIGSSDAALGAYHVDRSMIFVREAFAGSSIVDADRLAKAIEYTRFPTPNDPRFYDHGSEPGLVRAADLIGQIADPRYPQKLTHLYAEMCETGVASDMGFRSAHDLVLSFPTFFQTHVTPVIGPASDHLARTPEGAKWLHRLQCVVKEAEGGSLKGGPFAGAPQAKT